MSEGTAVSIPQWTTEGPTTRQVADHLTNEEWLQVVSSPSFDTVTREKLKEYSDNLISMRGGDPAYQIKIANGAIEYLHSSPTNRNIYQQLLAQIRPMALPVQLPDGQELTVPVKDSWSVGKLKAFLADKYGHDANAHRLFVGNAGRELRNDRSLRAELVNGQQPLSLKRANSYELFVNGPSNDRSIPISPNADVSDLRSRAARANGMEGGSLMWNGKPLQDGRSLSSYGIPAHSRVALTPRLSGG